MNTDICRRNSGCGLYAPVLPTEETLPPDPTGVYAPSLQKTDLSALWVGSVLPTDCFVNFSSLKVRSVPVLLLKKCYLAYAIGAFYRYKTKTRAQVKD